jgi:hypothetical protein
MHPTTKRDLETALGLIDNFHRSLDLADHLGDVMDYYRAYVAPATRLIEGVIEDA